MAPKDLTGLNMRDYGVPDSRLTVLYKDTSSLDEKWICQCECGNIISVKRANLIRKDKKGTRSCGCMRQEVKDRFTKIHYNDLTGKRFGKLVALKNNGSANNGYTLWECRCDCGTVCVVSSRDLLDGSTKSCGCLKSFGELIISKWLSDNKIDFEREYSFKDLIWIKPLRFDFKINMKDTFILLEYQGSQHYDINNPWYSKDGRSRDLLKQEYCKKHNIKLYEIYETTEEKILEKLKLIIERSDDLSD